MNGHKFTHLFAFAVWLLCTLNVQRASAYSDHRNHKTDSLETLLKNESRLTDEQRMDAYKSLMWAYLQTDGKRAAQYARKAIALSYSHDWQNVRADAQRILGMIAYGNERWDEAEDYYMQALATTDSMKQNERYKADDIDDNLSALYGSLGNLYNMQDMALLAIEYYQKAMPIFEKHGWLESLTLLHHNVAELYLSMGNDEKAQAEYLSAIKTAKKTNDSLIVAVPRKGLAKIYIDKGNYEKALSTLAPALAYFSAHRDEESDAYAEVLALEAKLNLMICHEDITKAKACINEAITYDNEELGAEVRRDIYAAAAMVAMRGTYICKEAENLAAGRLEEAPVLTMRVREILRLMVAGMSIKKMANKLCLGFETIHTYTKYLRQKLGCNNTASLVRTAIERHLV